MWTDSAGNIIDIREFCYVFFSINQKKPDEMELVLLMGEMGVSGHTEMKTKGPPSGQKPFFGAHIYMCLQTCIYIICR